MTAERVVRLGPLALALIAVLLLTGCAGDSFRADFARTFGSDEAVGGIELSTVDNMPFTGGVSAEVTARDGIADADLLALAGRLSAFAAERPAGEVRVVLDADRLSLPVSGDSAVTASRLSAALDLRDDPRVSSVALTADDDGESVNGLSLFLEESTPAEEAFTLARDAPDLLPDAGVPHVSVQSSDRSVLVRGAPGPWLDGAERVWAAVAEAVPTTGVRAQEERLVVALASEDDLAAAELAASVETAAGAVDFSSPLVALGDSASGEPARTVLAALAPEIRAEIRSVWTDDQRLRIAVDSIDRAGRVADALSDGAGALDLVTVTVGGDTPPLEVTAPPRSLGTAVTDASALLAAPGVVSVNRSERFVTVIASGDDSELERLLPSAQSLAPEGARVCVHRADGTGVCDTTAH
ncbi:MULTISPECIES: hypothetical protein [unclassified Rathayibacter]|uniref:hypothetical protein n=1 Tax=unclassified Rathayibacter TaxID=2609250 RepID=UPI0007004CE3|nr:MULTISPECIES: hypothetical protein [unclassified Rathayibacter]KQQ04099.1 hypothetical protein ASF42_11830 [Rathayibacter sp. Leaf294]KQS12553.1 hypothetical protein ASG06_11830 [Rathayibacter sp. Leaf185]